MRFPLFGASLVITMSVVLSDRIQLSGADEVSGDNPPISFSPIPKKIAPVPSTIVQPLSDLCQKVSDCEARGYFEEAREHLLEALDISRRQFDESHYMVRQFKCSLAGHDWITTLDDNQRTKYAQSRAMLLAAKSLIKEQKFDEALGQYEKIVQTFEELKVPPCPLTADIFEDMSIALISTDRAKEAISPAQKAYGIVCDSVSEFSPEAATALETLGEAHRSNGDYYNSIRELCRSCRVWNACVGEGSVKPSTTDGYTDALQSLMLDLLAVEDYDRTSLCFDALQNAIQQNSLTNKSRHYLICWLECELLNSKGQHREALAKADDLVSFAKSMSGAEADALLLDAQTIKAEILLDLNQPEQVEELIGVAFSIKFKGDLDQQLQNSHLTVVYARLLVAKNKYIEAADLLEQVIQGLEKKNGSRFSGLRVFLKSYSTALRHLGRNEEASKVDARIIEIKDSLAEMRRQIDADPECKFPWEK